MRVEEAVSWTQRFLTRNILPKKQSLFDKKNESKCLQKFYFSSKYNKEWYRKTTPHLAQPSRHVSLHRKNDKTNLFGYKLGELTENNKALLFFSWSLEAFQRVQI